MDLERLRIQIDVWRRELIDFSRRNRLLNLTTRTTSVDLVEPSPEVITQLLAAGKTLRIHPEWTDELVDADDVDAESDRFDRAVELGPSEVRSALRNRPKLASSLRSLKRRSDQEFLDRGIRILYLAVGLLHWTDQSETWTSPILLIPLELTRVSEGVYSMSNNQEEDIALNPALVEKLREDLGVEIDVTLDEERPFLVLQSLGEAIKARNGWSVEESASLGIFSFAKDVMYRDLKNNLDQVLASDLVSTLAFGSEAGTALAFERVPEEDLDRVAPPSKLNSILDTDSTQRQAIIAARDGNSFVMDGPPGTGKSQTIANIISEQIASGKSVLFVSEKAAALEVVQKRLENAGLGSFLLPLHSQKVTRKEFAQVLMKAVNERVRAGRELSSTQLERLERNQTKLSAYVAAVNEIRSPLGKSLHDVIGEFAKLSAVPSAPIPTASVNSSLSAQRVLEIEDAARQLSRVWGAVDAPNQFVWRGLKSPRATLTSRVDVLGKVDRVLEALSAIQEMIEITCEDTGIPSPDTVIQMRAISKLRDLDSDMSTIPVEWLTADDFDAFLEESRKSLHLIESLQMLNHECRKQFADWLSLDPELGDRVNRKVSQDEETGLNELPDQLTKSELQIITSEIRKSLTDLQDSMASIRELERAFGQDPRNATLRYADSLAQVAVLSQSRNLPEENWFTETGLAEARSGLQTVRPLIQEYSSSANLLLQHFDRKILKYPAALLFPQNGTEPELGILNSRGRENRKALTALSKSQKLSRANRPPLSSLKRMDEIKSALDSNQKIRSALGTSYFKGVDTDCSAIEEAIMIVDVSNQRLETQSNPKLAIAMGRGSNQLSAIGPLGLQILSALSGISACCGEYLSVDFAESQIIQDVANEVGLAISRWEELLELIEPCEAGSLPARELIGLLRSRSKYENLLQEIVGRRIRDESALLHFYSGVETDVNAAKQAIQLTASFREAFSVPPTQRLAQRIRDGELAIDSQISQTFERFDEHLKGLLSEFDDFRSAELLENFTGDFDSCMRMIQSWRDDSDQIGESVVFADCLDLMKSFGVDGVLEYAVEQRIPQADIPDLFAKAVLGAWIESIFSEDKERLTPLDKSSRDETVKEYSSVDRQLKHHSAYLVAAKANARRPTTLIGVAGIIQRESKKKSRHMRIAALLDQTREVAQSVKPCFMMSPLTVSAFLPPSISFDTVIFDEASQLLTSNAINAVYRCKQLIIAGDENQLPPTSFFDRGLDEDDSDEYVEDNPEMFESVLHQAKAGGFEQVGLRWHYRSRHESLITYSNYSFYNGRLVTYPSALQESDELGVHYTNVPDGVYKRSGSRTNTVEAQKVVERVFYYADHFPSLSVGVVAFSNAQANEIENQLDAARRSRPDLDNYFTSDRLDGFFVKNLESVQGDERDVILFSVGYGRDENGKLTMNFGPVNRDGGWRRLNVAFTRARNRVELVSSISAGDFSDVSNVNVGHLKRYFDYAERGTAALAYEIVETSGGPESPFEEEVMRTIHSWGFAVESQVGQAGYRIDMAIRDPSRPGSFVLGIECDGAAYHSSRVARDRDRLRQEVLEGLGWQLYRIWGPTWYNSRVSAERELRLAIESAVARSGVEKEKTEESAAPEPSYEVVNAEFKDAAQFIRSYYPERIPPVVVLAIGRDGAISGHAIDEFIVETVRREGPVSMNMVRRRFATAADRWLTKRVQSAIDSHIRKLIDGKVVNVYRTDVLAFPSQIFLARRPDERDPLTKRSPKDIALLEIACAIGNFVGAATAIEISEVEQLVTRQIFGWDRITTQWRDVIAETIELLNNKWWILDGHLLKKGPELPFA